MPDKWQYEVNGNGLNNLDPIVTNESHTDFFDAKGGGSTVGCGNCEFAQDTQARLLVHKVAGTESYAIFYCAGKDHSTSDSGHYTHRLDWDEPIFSQAAYILQDGLPSGEGDKYGATYCSHHWIKGCADGWVIDAGAFSDVTFTGDPDTSFSGDPVTDFGVVTDSLGNFESAGITGQVRITVPDDVQRTTGGKQAAPGTRVAILREDMAHL